MSAKNSDHQIAVSESGDVQFACTAPEGGACRSEDKNNEDPRTESDDSSTLLDALIAADVETVNRGGAINLGRVHNVATWPIESDGDPEQPPTGQ